MKGKVAAGGCELSGLRLMSRPGRAWPHPPVHARYKVQLGKMLDEKRFKGTASGFYLRNVDVQWGRINVEDLPQMDFGEGEREKYALKRGDVLICEGGECGRAAIWNDELDECFFQKAIHRLRPLKTGEDEPRFFVYVMRAAVERNIFSAFGTGSATIEHLPAERLRAFRYPSPPVSEQRRIADYLDVETAQMDALVTEKERMLALLEEKRAALVSHAVTRGLNPRAKLKPSGLAWLGDIPVHWETRRLKFLLAGIDQGFSPQCHNAPADDGAWGVLKTGCVNGGVFRSEENKALPDDVQAPADIAVHLGDVLMSRASGSLHLIGSVARVSTAPAARLLLSDKIYRLLVNAETMDADYLVLAMGSSVLRHEIQSYISGAEGLANNIAKSDIRELLIPLPPLAEQRAIVAMIAEERGRTAVFREALERSIALLKERRSALITAAVTGQISVPGGGKPTNHETTHEN